MTPAVEAAKSAGIAFELHEYEGVEVGEGDYATAVGQNMVHGSDSPESAAREIGLFFGELA